MAGTLAGLGARVARRVQHFAHRIDAEAPISLRARRAPPTRYSTLSAAGSGDSPGFFFGTRTRRLNSATRTPSWLRTRVWTLTMPRSGFDFEGLTSRTSVSQKRVSPWKTGFGWLSSSVARLAIALPETSETDMPSASE